MFNKSFSKDVLLALKATLRPVKTSIAVQKRVFTNFVFNSPKSNLDRESKPEGFKKPVARTGQQRTDIRNNGKTSVHDFVYNIFFAKTERDFGRLQTGFATFLRITNNQIVVHETVPVAVAVPYLPTE